MIQEEKQRSKLRDFPDFPEQNVVEKEKIEVLPLDHVIDLIECLESDETDKKELLKQLLDVFSKAVYNLPENSFFVIINYFMAYQETDEEDYYDDNDEDNSGPIIHILINLIHEIMKYPPNFNRFIILLANYEIMKKLFEYFIYSWSLIHLIITKYPAILPVIKDLLEYLLSTNITDNILQIMYDCLNIDPSIIPANQFMSVLDDILRKQYDTNLYATALSILNSIFSRFPQITPIVTQSIQEYISMDGDSVDIYYILEIYKKLLLNLESFKDVVNDKFLNLIVSTLSLPINTDTDNKQTICSILLLKYDLEPFLPFSAFLSSLLGLLEESEFFIQRTILIFFSRILAVCSINKIEASDSIITVLYEIFPHFYIPDDDQLICSLEDLAIVFLSNEIELSEDIIKAIGEMEMNQNDEIAKKAEAIMQMIS